MTVDQLTNLGPRGARERRSFTATSSPHQGGKGAQRGRRGVRGAPTR